jgi:hypothetical protein
MVVIDVSAWRGPAEAMTPLLTLNKLKTRELADKCAGQLRESQCSITEHAPGGLTDSGTFFCQESHFLSLLFQTESQSSSMPRFGTLADECHLQEP